MIMIRKSKAITISSISFILFILLIFSISTQNKNHQKNKCFKCYKPSLNQNCQVSNIQKDNQKKYYTLHMSVHPHLDAFWIFDFQDYYNPNPNDFQVSSYFASNRFSSVKQIFSTTLDVLTKSKNKRQNKLNKQNKQNQSMLQSSHRSFFNSQIGFFKRWYEEQNQTAKYQVKDLLKTKYWQILGGGVVQHDQGCAYYEDIITNFQTGLDFMKKQFNYLPKISISADSFGHSQSTLAILAHLGIQGYFVQRSDENILLQNKTQFIWKAKSANNYTYGALPTHVRWAIHGFQDQFIDSGESYQNMCESKQRFIQNLRRQNQFLKGILKSNHIMRYFGHDFQKFDDYSYKVMQTIMEQFSKEKCNKVIAVYGNPTQYFITLMSQVYGQKVKQISTRSQDIFPIWDFDSGLYWTGYFTTDPYHKKIYRTAGRYLQLFNKAASFIIINTPNKTLHQKIILKSLQNLSFQVSYLQHHDGISGTSKYKVLDKYEQQTQIIIKQMISQIIQPLFDQIFPINSDNPIFYCLIGQEVCKINQQLSIHDLIILKLFNSGGGSVESTPLIIKLPQNELYEPNCQYQINCLCQQIENCPCSLYLYPQVGTFSFITLKKVKLNSVKTNLLSDKIPNKLQKIFKFSNNQIYYLHQGQHKIKISYKCIPGQATSRQFSHLSRYGQRNPYQVFIKSGKYALGNNPNIIEQISSIKKVLYLQSQKNYIILIKWSRQLFKTKITIPKSEQNIKINELKFETYFSASGYHLYDYYLVLQADQKYMNSNKVFYTDSNGWLVMRRQINKHEDYQAQKSKQKYDQFNANTYPMTAFAYIQDINNPNIKISINTDRPQGVTSYSPNSLWINIDRLTGDDGKWVYETTYRSQYQKFTHFISFPDKDNNNNQRNIQKRIDNVIILQGNIIPNNQRYQNFSIDQEQVKKWSKVTKIDDVKFTIRPQNQKSLVLRIHNLNDYRNITLNLFSDHFSTFLTSFFHKTVTFQQIQQVSLGANMNYKQFIKNKWNWNDIVDIKQQNSIFNKKFGESIQLRPLQIRTFRLKQIKFDQKCIKADNFKQKLSNFKQIQNFQINLQKPFPTRNQTTLQKLIAEYMLNEDHCKIPSPVTHFNIKNMNTNDISALIEQENKQQNAKQPDILPQPKIQPQKQKQIPIYQSPSQQQKYQAIKQKVFSLIVLTKQQKQIYFSRRFSQIQKGLNK